MNVDFDTSIDLAGHHAMRGAWGYLLKPGPEGDVVADSVRAAVFSERIHFRFRVPRADVHGAAIEFEVPDRYRVELDMWHSSSIPVVANYKLRTPEVTQGNTVFIDLELTSVEKGVLFFTTICQHGYRLRHVESGESAAWPYICGEALSSIEFEANETKKIQCEVPTESWIWREFGWVENRTLPLGVYELECCVIGYAGWGLRAEFEFEVVP